MAGTIGSIKYRFGNTRFVLKQYIFSEDDLRDRIVTEYSFLNFAWTNGLRQIPEPLCCDQKNLLSLFTFIDGRKLKKNEVKEEQIKQAVDFINQLNQYKQTKEAATLPMASEACFNFESHIYNAQNRMNRWENLTLTDDIERKAKQFIDKTWAPLWEKLKRILFHKFIQKGLK